ncbi:probable LRR receptor-like serine/threonine-protein kinase At3g47570 [Cornus florida]|uniref:probable LRR receptor-like serine/threonine-protein kinase At3g47570 n=1 Tax=Cornus florida TaxID=4283 RepID=UPI002896B2F6|nr:probable LRR receptor-like serine/threonine-protein kinase At3g47570 [Cornus florida]XP_059650350.1 probable LRR receptor-like serine/threonine-protein kinase At3g47570 [Cornus florida]XP_059650352.1 probable LRR receptor-like serine/threonine-protein kinase At3g47570 [Cornus florida]
MSSAPSRSLHMLITFLLFITLLHVTTLHAATATSTNGGNNTDHLALLAFKSMIINDPQWVLSSWNNESFHFCEWEGVKCGHRHRRVTILDLGSKGLVGSLSPHIGNMSFLRMLRLDNNTLQGEIPPQLSQLFRLQRLNLSSNHFEGEIPANLSHCSDLTHLLVGNNKLVGKFPKELAFLNKIKSLAIYKNYLTGGIPLSIGNLTSLESVSAARNNFGGSLPDILGQLKNLRQFGFGGNKLSGTIPPSIYNLSMLTILSLAGNELSGSLPPSLGIMLPHLNWLQLWGNQFTGLLPFSISNCSALENLQMERNYFNGKIPFNFGGLPNLVTVRLQYNNLGSGEPDEMSFISSMANCSNLKVFSLNVNQLRGLLPNSVGNLSNQLVSLTLGGNLFYGKLPSTIGNLVNLTMLGLENNQFVGTIPASIGNLQNLQQLGLDRNNFFGRIPDSLGNLSLLIELFLASNRLEGNIPPSLGRCTKLLSLNLSHNNLNGTIPEEIFGVSALSIALDLGHNHFSGSLPSEVGNLKNLRELVISENKFSGELPSSLGSCSSLENLYLDKNFFNGSIPRSLSSLRGIQDFDLSQNNFSGQVPRFLENFSLKNLNMSFNDFEGEVPMEGVFKNASAISVAGNSRLCGGIPDLQLPKCSFKESKKGRKRFLVVIIVVSVVCSVLGLSMVVSFLFCKKKRKGQHSGSSTKEVFLKVSYERLLKATDGFSAANLIGVGSYGSVYKGMLDEDETSVVAVKVLNLQRRGASKSFMTECEALRNIRHRNLLKVITSCSSVDFHGNDFKALVYEFMSNGSLEKWLKSDPETETGQNEIRSLNLLQRINIAIDVASALEYLHNHCETPIVHCDLKPSNVLLDGDMVAHVGDFGVAMFIQQLSDPKQSNSIAIRGTVGYVAPEYGLGSQVSTKGDVYSYGVLVLEMMTGKRPTDGMFVEGLNLHSFAKMALPDCVIEIAHPMLMNIDEEEKAVVPNKIRLPIKSKNDIQKECVISMIKIGVACSMEAPQDRMDISNAVHELNLVRDILQGN